MNIFVLCTGRCGSTTFTRAAQHITNFTAGHETRSGLIGHARFDYPSYHIEADNRLSWLLGRLNSEFGDNAYYVHLRRDRVATAESFTQRWNMGIMSAYRKHILSVRGGADLCNNNKIDVALDYVDTVNFNIALFLKNKTHTMDFIMEDGRKHFSHFWDWIGAEGNKEAALSEWGTRHNASKIS